jgi:virginiamycin A acetyltransferase
LKRLLKALLNAISLTLAYPLALSTGFGRSRALFQIWAQALALVPGLPGNYLRIAYYSLVLEGCTMESRIEFGSFFSHPKAKVGHRVYIGSYCILGRTQIGDRTQIGSGVQILSGARQHGRGADGRIESSNLDHFVQVAIGPDCWIGASAIVMADLGEQVTIGAGSVVTRPIPAKSTAVGSPARPLPPKAA